MSEERKLEDNVQAFLSVAQKDVARAASETFEQSMWSECTGDMAITSPIEKLLWIAMNSLCHIHYEQFNPDPIKIDGKDATGYGFLVIPQYKVGKYRVDFFVQHNLYKRECAPWVVECDGHIYHERSKIERQYEKERDRFLARKGFKIMHFTGSEIVADPYKVASEVLNTASECEHYPTPINYWGD